MIAAYIRLLYFFNDRLQLLKFIVNQANGRDYGIGWVQRWRLARRVIGNCQKVSSLSTWQQQLLMIAEILRTPKALPGDVVECGCYNGASSVNLSLACGLIQRKLFICDSFEGLPEPGRDEQYDINADNQNYYVWEKGEFSAPLELVKRNVEKYGDLSACVFVKGFFNESLITIGTNHIILVFEDADLASSVADCLKHLWPKLQDGGRFFSHEPWSMHVVSLFYDKKWWAENFKTPSFFGP